MKDRSSAAAAVAPPSVVFVSCYRFFLCGAIYGLVLYVHRDNDAAPDDLGWYGGGGVFSKSQYCNDDDVYDSP